ncbi:Tetratricopeptide repeat (TPR)-like superfamily protein [Arabidopsis thaliana]|uniref:Putative pentatricopeptide repeat-containing protein At5g36300 n=1 Tax=Arabidopsis thaliana TaxID=3702 RepID=PP402_ARATH|nr:Tetratricopeptide repeat (TPR)-like superfamily protein [Arabidopsis thaliana]Q9FFZ2.3 RecName: Full=Putative pentatricopeptide repeat-containing protein At5g36300 [Arabidopsis thaliana]ANM71076.1 Tetratricopeptide repeat (TPR)-like superfamily protein [Arabidopsis thaliana]|eukprot:NP_001332632.1 Tetratricopeptide repeat (TPR)-like superfamily protein [Arabidopsis thaliana]
MAPISHTRISLSMYNSWIRYFCRTGETNEAMSLLAEIHSLGSRPDPLSYVSFIETLASLRRTLEADALFHEVVRFMIYGSYSVRLYNALVSRYLRKEVSWRVVNEMKKRKFRLNSFVYGKIIRIYRDNGMWKKALGIVEEIREIGLPMDVEIYNSVIDTFGKYGELDEELQVLEKLQRSSDSRPNIRTWNSLIRWHCHHGAVDMALELFTMIFEDIGELVGKLKSQGVAPSANLFCTLANAYAQQGLCKQTVKVLKMMENEGIEPNLIMLNVLINAFGTAGKHMEALSIYHHIKETVWIHPDVVTYSTLMKAFTRAKKYEMVCSFYLVTL